MLFSILKGNSANISTDKTAFHEGWAYFTPDTGKFYIDAKVGSTNKRILINPDYVTESTLTTALSGKSDTSHTHDGRYYTEDEIDSMLLYKAASDHNHDDRYYTESEINTKLNSINTQVAGKADASHTHDDRYYTETEINTKLSGKSDIDHSHSDLVNGNVSVSLNAASASEYALSPSSVSTQIPEASAYTYTLGTASIPWNKLYATDIKLGGVDLKTSLTNLEGEVDGSIKSLSVSGKTITYTKNDGSTGTITTQDTNTDTMVTNTKANTTKAYVTGTTSASTNTGTQVFDTGVYLDTTAGQLVANTFKGNLTGNASSATTATTATSATSATKATQDGSGNVITSTYETKTAANSKLDEAKAYADTAATTVKNDLLNGAGAAYDTLKELGDLIDTNTDAIEALEKVASGKANASHTHAISDVTNLQTVLDGKAASSHGTHVTYSTSTPAMDGTGSTGSASTVARSDHKHPTDTSRASQADFTSHTGNTTSHITSTERTNWNAAKSHADSAHAPSNAEKNQNAFSNIAVGTTTVAADSATDTVTFVGSNVTITPDATNDQITFAVANGSTSTKGIVQLTNSTSSTSTTTAATPNSVKQAYDLANTALTTANGKASSSHTHTIANITSLQTSLDGKQATITGGASTIVSSNLTASRVLVSNASGKVAASDVTSTELNYLDGVGANIQTQLDGKAASGHTHSAATSSAAGFMSASDKSKLDGITANADSVSFSRSLTSGTKVGTITINGTSTDLYAPTNTDTHYTSGTIVGNSTSATSNSTSALSNGSVYLNHVEAGSVKNSHKISGSGATTVTSDASGNIVISSTNTTYGVATSSTLGLVKSGTDITVDSSGNVSVNDNSHAHTIANVTNLQSTLDGKVPTTRTVNGKALSSNITLSASDVSAYSKSDIDSFVFITTADIDEICNATIQSASEVSF